MKTHGREVLANGYAFAWMTDSAGEVCGHVEAPDHSIVRGTYGFYRTKDAKEAARVAESNLYYRGTQS